MTRNKGSEMGRGRRTGEYLQERGKGERQIAVEIEVKWDEGVKRKQTEGEGKESCLSIRRKNIQQGDLLENGLENGTAVTAWGRRIEFGAPTRAVS